MTKSKTKIIKSNCCINSLSQNKGNTNLNLISKESNYKP